MSTAAKNKTGKTLVVVESPAKAKTIEKYLGRNFTVCASMGHLRDLPKSQFGIDTENNFAPKYINIRGKGDIIKTLKKAAQKADKVYLASDPDREGEAIAWHLSYILGLNPETDCRIIFNEITKNAIKQAVEKPHPIDMARVDAQQARRMLDRIVGYKLSPLLWRKVKKGLSAGRVQSVAVKLICDREREIEAFNPQEYHTLNIKLKKGRSPLPPMQIAKIKDQRLARNADDIENGALVLKTEDEAAKIVADVKKQIFAVTAVQTGHRAKNPMPPFTTSTLQQDAARRLGFTSKKTMMLAQQLYEGVTFGHRGSMGLITYMRTDSVRISAVAQEAAREFIAGEFGADYVPTKPHVYAAKKKAQDAHEAIRPTDITITPDVAEKHLNKDQAKLYRLIWQRFAACQMSAAQYDTITADILGGKDYFCQARGSRKVFDGFTRIYEADGGAKGEKDINLPELAPGDKLILDNIESEQHFTQPPPRYNDASIVKTLEEKEIGRPSTYAPIIDTILSRGYVQRSEKTFRPTEIGFLVIDMLDEYFKDIVNVEFTAKMERELDKVAEGKIPKERLLTDFYTPFEKNLTTADEAIGHVELPLEYSGEICEKCGRPMIIKLSRYGKFQACSGFPECRNAKPILKDTGAKCPKCGGRIIERKSKRGRLFYGCERYPDCDFTTWDAPQKEPCKECGAAMFLHRMKKGGALIYCCNENCSTRQSHPINKLLERQKAAADKTTTTSAASKATRSKSAAKTTKTTKTNTVKRTVKSTAAKAKTKKAAKK